jgi:hypothetical protein
MILFDLLVELELRWIFAWDYIWMLRIHVNFSGIFESISYLIGILFAV